MAHEFTAMTSPTQHSPNTQEVSRSGLLQQQRYLHRFRWRVPEYQILAPISVHETSSSLTGEHEALQVAVRGQWVSPVVSSLKLIDGEDTKGSLDYRSTFNIGSF